MITIAKPRKKKNTQLPQRIAIYFFLIISALFFLIPFYIVFVTSFKDMEEIRLGSSIVAFPESWTIQPWKKAWSGACTGLQCTGLQPGFWNSVKILIPSVIISIGVASITGYAMALWRVKWANILLTFLMLGAFIPFQVIMYPLIKVATVMQIYNSIWGVVFIHTIFGLPVLTLIFRNFYVSLPEEIIKAAKIDCGEFWKIYLYVVFPLSSMIFMVALILQVTGVWNDYMMGLTFAGREAQPMTVLLNNIVNTTYGEREYNVNMAASLLTALPPLVVYFISGKYFVRGITAGAVKG